jgi:hypothetical protein
MPLSRPEYATLFRREAKALESGSLDRSDILPILTERKSCRTTRLGLFVLKTMRIWERTKDSQSALEFSARLVIGQDLRNRLAGRHSRAVRYLETRCVAS